MAIPTEAIKPKKLTEKDMGAYLFTYFSDPTHALFMAISYDGYTFTPLNNGEPVISGDSIPSSTAYVTRTSTAHPTASSTSP